MRKTAKLLALIAVVIALFAFTFTVSAEVTSGWDQNPDGTWSYYEDGYMVYDQEIWYEGHWYRIDENGIMLENEWYEANWGDDWYYYGAGGKAACGKVWVDGNYYLFEVDGFLVKYRAIEIQTSTGYECYYGDENGYAITLPNNQWKEINTEWNTEWYYVLNGRLCHSGIYKIGGAYYCFYGDGSLATNTTYQTGDKCYYCADNGVARELVNNQWTKIGDEWYYVKNGELPDGITTVGGATYYFFNGRMAADELIYANYYDEGEMHWVDCRYYAKPDGVLAKNLWFEYDGYWRYAGDDYSVYNNGLTKIGPYYYYFYSWYAAAQNEVIETDDGVYIIGDNCRATKANGWFKHPVSKEWMYVKGNEFYTDGIYTIDGVKYAFDWEGAMITDTIKYFDGYYYLINSNGEVVTTYGWQKFGGEHYFVNSDSTLAEGWLLNGGTWYYMQPAMSYCDIITEDGWLYYTNVKGEYKQITGNGFYDLGESIVYLKNNKVVVNAWEKINGKWYYFAEGGRMIHNAVFHIKGHNYYFDASGAMADKGWTRTSNGSWVYANSDGTLYVGKDGAGYIFNGSGYLQVNTTTKYAGTWYVTNSDGKAIGSLKNNDWTKVNGYWYYVEDGELVTFDFIDNKGNYYYFDGNGRMMSGGFYGGRFLSGTGEAKKGWIKYDGRWYYGDPDDYGYLFYNGIYLIDGKKYFFVDRILQQNATLAHYDMVITTNADGVVTKEVSANGWTYDSTGDYGSVYYYENGKGYNGWKGDYYLRDGYLVTDEVIEYKGKSYYVGVDGRYIRNGWHEIWGDYMFARGDGSLAEDEWIATNNGKYWYYFDGYLMVYDRVMTIDGVKHQFNAEGVWKGEYKAASYKDGWQKIGGKWYFYMAGEKVRYQELYDGGKWYYFDYNGEMITNQFAYSNSDVYCYYGADGARVNYKGWKLINGKWTYFDDKGYTSYGWIFDGSNYYYQDWYYIVDKNGEETASGIGMITGYVVTSRVLSYFGSDGKYVKAITATGWYSDKGVWYYVENGRALTDGIYTIGNANYAFDYDGQMVSNRVYDGRYFGTDGKMVTKQGWYYNSKQKVWHYVTSNGYAAMWGIYKIDGKEYVFEYGDWIK